MTVGELLKGIKYRGKPDLNTEIVKLTFDSREVEEGTCFFAMKGSADDGNKYIAEAAANGAALIVTESAPEIDVPYVLVKDVRLALPLAAANFYHNYHKDLRIIAVTGTNGKTTTCRMLAGILRAAGKSVAVFGTLGITINNRELPANLTTPDPIELHRLFQIAYLAGVEYVIMEASAHAIFLQKLRGVKFEIVVFTNLTQDHLDYFGTMDNYKEAKKKLFCTDYAGICVINADDPCGMELIEETDVPTATYGIYNPSDTFAIDADYHDGTRCVINSFDDIFELKTSFTGEFNIYNTLAAIETARLLSVEIDIIRIAFFRMTEVAGRFNVINGPVRVIIDYAHTPDGLKNLLAAARGLTEGELILVFGCGGNRDQKKRPIMGKIAAENADFTVITSDNSRFEEPGDIIAQIEKGFTGVSDAYISIAERQHAIAYAIARANPTDVVVVAGKGAENYMDEMGIKKPFSDREEVLGALEKLKK